MWCTVKKLATLAVLREEIETACAAIYMDTLVNVAQAVVHRNQKCLDTDGNHFEHLLQLQKSNVTCIHLLLSVQIEYYNFNTVFPFLKMCILFLVPSVYISPYLVR